MNVKDYISSGIVESYVLGLVEDAERIEFEQLCATHPEIRAARDAFERSLEQNALADSVAPPSSVKNSLFAELDLRPEMPVTGKATDDQYNQPAKVVTIKWPRYVAAASIVLLVGSLVANIYFYNRYKETNDRYEALVQQQSTLVNNNKTIQARLDVYENTLARLRDPNMVIVKMAGTAVPAAGSPAPGSVATVYWDANSKDVYLLVNNLPDVSAGKQYQLWAIVDGQPVDAGVFDVHEGNMVVKMKNIPRAQLFAVTLEQKGGSPVPKGPMYVLGKA